MTNRIKIEDIGLEDKIRPYTECEDEFLKAMSVEVRISFIPIPYRQKLLTLVRIPSCSRSGLSLRRDSGYLAGKRKTKTCRPSHTTLWTTRR